MLAHAGQRSTGDLVCGLADVPIYYIDSILRLTIAEALQNRFIPVLQRLRFCQPAAPTV